MSSVKSLPPWLVQPGQKRYDLAVDVGGVLTSFWIEVKRELNMGELSRMREQAVRNVTSDFSKMEIDFSALAVARAAAYLVDWSLDDGQANKLRLDPNQPLVSIKTLGRLSPVFFKAIDDAIGAHVLALEEEKKLTSGVIVPDEMSA